MVPPSPFFNVGVDFNPLIQRIETDLVPIATTTDVTAAVAPLATTTDVTAAVAPLATTTDVTAAVAPLATTTDVTAAVAPLATTTDVQEITDAIGERTNEETIFGQISSLKCLIVKHWFIEQAIEYVLNRQVKG